MTDDLNKIPIHNNKFSEKEFFEMIEFLNNSGINNEMFKIKYPDFWRMVNRMSYIVSTGEDVDYIG